MRPVYNKANLGPHLFVPPSTVDVITFRPSSSPELDDVLDKIRSKIILLSYLTADQRRRIFSPHHVQKLRNDPIPLDVNGEIVQFSHMDLFNDIPNARAATIDAVGRMTTRADFQNLPRLLEGLHRSSRRLRQADYARIARRAGERQCIIAVIESAAQVQRTGFRLESSEVVAEILTHVQMKAVDSNWDEAETRQALRWAEQVIDLLQRPDHGRRPPRQQTHRGSFSDNSSAATAPLPPPPTYPLDRDPQVLAARLHLAAVVADKFAPGGADTDGKVSRYATELVQLWPAGGKGLRALSPTETYTDRRGEMHYLSVDNKFLGVGAPLLHGLDTAIRVLGGSQGDSAALAGELQSRRDALAVEVNAALEAAPDRRGAVIYKKVFGESTEA
ncbi:uncharacterized protein SPSK_09434 [Sporothrix schenckii 1099-18]|uniref:Uncharacterized protein n=1 Tax=Sporothrix schenckii 1099-18 TaxID=1397361 RepID=A0A0F2MC24_SPOSC|nr:uncharacterized protein SPSK_09434 [Sporothrix schenckii 1099-18]KJR85706.1 hypothetical protein SPSK_09434 [Sporothrix schenckii 1099-18]